MKKQIGKQTIHYLDEGSGKALVFLHGWGTDATDMWPVAKSFAKTYRVIAIDFPGFGESPRPDTTWHVRDYAELLVRFLGELGLAEVEALIGHSFGGRVGIKAFSEASINAKKLVLIDSAGVKLSDNLRKLVYKLVAKSGKRVLAAPGLRRFSATAKQKLYKSAGSSDYMNAGDMSDILIATVSEDLSNAATHIAVPTLIIWGSEDKETPLADARHFHSAIKSSKLKIIQGAGHFPHTDNPRKVIRLLGEFLA